MIPPKRYTRQSDVETVHRLVEDEFFDPEHFGDRDDFFGKVTTYWSYFNLLRPNRGKEWKSPLQILQDRAPNLAGALLHWQPLNLSLRHHAYFPNGYLRGNALPRYPSENLGVLRSYLCVLHAKKDASRAAM